MAILEPDLYRALMAGHDPPDIGSVRALFPGRPRWMLNALCRQSHPGITWFPAKTQPTGPAKAVCAVCPAREPCLAYALADPHMQGVWAGTTPRERRAIRRRGIA